MSRSKKRAIESVDNEVAQPKKKKQKIAKDENTTSDSDEQNWVSIGSSVISLASNWRGANYSYCDVKSGQDPENATYVADHDKKGNKKEAADRFAKLHADEKTRFTFLLKPKGYPHKNSYGQSNSYSMIFRGPNKELLVDRLVFLLLDTGKLYESGSTGLSLDLKRPLNCTLLEDLFRAIGKPTFDSELNSEQWKIEVRPTTVEKDKKAFRIEFKVNPKVIEKAVHEGKTVEFEDIIIRHQEREVMDFLDKESKKFLEIKNSLHPFIPAQVEEPKGLKDGFKFHRYQLDAINWMSAIEKDSDKEMKYCDLVPWRQSNTSLMMDLHSLKFVPASKMEEYYGGIKAKGGVLADAVGLGKTLELIGLSLLTLKNARENLPDYDDNGLINTRATLVVCPNHLAKQWADEIIKYTDLKVVIYATLDDFNNTTYQDFIEAGFVIVTSAIFKNKNYFTLGCGNKKVAVNRPMIPKRSRLVKEHLEELKNGETKLQTVGPILDNFHWPRIIVDEAHEVFNDPFLSDCLGCISKSIGWWVSATPFPSLELFDAAKRFLEIWDENTEHEDTLGEKYEAWVENDVIYNNLIWRNVKESVGEEYKVPDFEEDLVYVDFHPIERLIHSEGTLESNLELCSGVIPYNASLDGVADKNLNDATLARIRFVERNANLQLQLDDVNKNHGGNPWWIQSLTKEIAENEQKIRNFNAEIAKWTNVERVLGGKNITDPTVIQELSLINNYGSKMARLINWLNDSFEEDDNNRFILFSKFSDYLTKIHRVLHKAGISAVHLEGYVVTTCLCSCQSNALNSNVIQKTKKLAQFKQDNVKVLLMSLGNSAAGTNLIEANYVVLVDPMQGSVEEARAYEMQALGRAHRQGQDQKVHLVRFVVRDSVEEELYTRNKSSGRTNNNNTNRPLLARSSSLATSQELNRAGSALNLHNNNNNTNTNNE